MGFHSSGLTGLVISSEFSFSYYFHYFRITLFHFPKFLLRRLWIYKAITLFRRLEAFVTKSLHMQRVVLHHVIFDSM